MKLNETTKAKTPKFSLVFLTWNSKEEVLKSLSYVEDLNFEDYEVVVVDNDSDDDTVESIRSRDFDFNLTLVENEENLGFSAGINRGIEVSNGEFICGFNEDTLLPEDYLNVISDKIHDEAVWVTARENHRVSEDKKCVRLLSDLGFTLPYYVNSLSGIAEVNFVPGDGFIIPRKILSDNLGGQVFDPRLPFGGEDLDLSVRLNSDGIPIMAILDTYSIHPDREDRYDLSLSNLTGFLNNIRGHLLVANKNRDLGLGLFSLLHPLTRPISTYFLPYPRSSERIKARIE